MSICNSETILHNVTSSGGPTSSAEHWTRQYTCEHMILYTGKASAVSLSCSSFSSGYVAALHPVGCVSPYTDAREEEETGRKSQVGGNRWLVARRSSRYRSKRVTQQRSADMLPYNTDAGTEAGGTPIHITLALGTVPLPPPRRQFPSRYRRDTS